MYVRTVSRKNKDGSIVEYIQLAHNYRDPNSGYARAKVIHSFGRKDQLDVAAIKRLVKSLCRFLGPEEALKVEDLVRECRQDLRFVQSRSMGGIWVLRALWKRLEINHCLETALAGGSISPAIEATLLAMVAKLALAADSNLAVEQWVRKDVYLEEADGIQVNHLSRGIDFLQEHEEAIQREVFRSMANLLDLEMNEVLLGTTSMYLEPDTEHAEGLHGCGKRRNLAQLVIGLAVTRQGLPIRGWVFPGNTADVKTVEKVQAELEGWGRVVWVADRDMNRHRIVLQRALRALKAMLEPRPMHQEDRIRSHVTLAWLALLLVRLVEVKTGQSWDRVRHSLGRIHLGDFFTRNGRILQRTELTQDQYYLLKQLDLQPPPLVQTTDS